MFFQFTQKTIKNTVKNLIFRAKYGRDPFWPAKVNFSTIQYTLCILILIFTIFSQKTAAPHGIKPSQKKKQYVLFFGTRNL